MPRQLSGTVHAALSRKPNTSSFSHSADPGSDSSEDEMPNINTIGDVPLHWYKDEDHIGLVTCLTAHSC